MTTTPYTRRLHGLMLDAGGVHTHVEHQTIAAGPALTNNYSVLAAAITAMPAAGLTLQFGPGTYTLDWLVQTTLPGPVTFRGVGEDTVLKLKNSATVGLVKALAGSAAASLTFQRMTIDGNKANQGAGVLDLVQWDGLGALQFEDIAFKSFTARAIYSGFTNNLPYFRCRRFTVSDVAETTDAALAGGAGLAYLPIITGPVDIGDGRLVQAAVSNTLYAPYGFNIQGTAGQTLSGTIEDLYFEKYGHKGIGNPLGCVDVYNYGNDLTIRGIVGRAIAHTLVKANNGSRITIDAKVIGQTGSQSYPAVQVGAGAHSVTGDFPDPDISVKGTGFTNGPLLNVTGTSGNEVKNPRIFVDGRACLQAVFADFLDGGQINAVAEASTGTTTPQSTVYLGSGCKNQVSVFAKIKGAASYALYGTGSALDVEVLPGSVFDTNNTALQHIRFDTVRDVSLLGVKFLGVPTNIVFIATAAAARIFHCEAPVPTTISYSSVTLLQQFGNSWQPKVGMSADRGDANVTLTVGGEFEHQKFATTLTANRTVTLSTTNANNGDHFRIVRTGLGAFTLDVGGLKTIPSATAAFVDVMFDTAWRLDGYGTL